MVVLPTGARVVTRGGRGRGHDAASSGPGGRRPRKSVNACGHQLPHGGADDRHRRRRPTPASDHLELGRELQQHLPAGAARRASAGAVGQMAMALNSPAPSATAAHHGGAFGAERQPEAGVLHVGAGDHRAVGAAQGRADPEPGIRRVAALASLAGGGLDAGAVGSRS